MKRRSLLKALAAAAGVLVIPPAFAAESQERKPVNMFLRREPGVGSTRVKFGANVLIDGVYVDGVLLASTPIVLLADEYLELDVEGTHFEIWFNTSHCLTFQIEKHCGATITVPVPEKDGPLWTL